MINTYANVMRLAKELEQEQTSHAETRKLLLKACVEKAIITEGDGRIVNDGRTATDEWWRGFARWTCARLTAAPEPTNQEPA